MRATLLCPHVYSLSAPAFCSVGTGFLHSRLSCIHAQCIFMYSVLFRENSMPALLE